MKKLMELMAEELASAFEKAGYDPEYGKVTVSNRPDLCEYQCNGAMAGAKAYKKAPSEESRPLHPLSAEDCRNPADFLYSDVIHGSADGIHELSPILSHP